MKLVKKINYKKNLYDVSCDNNISLAVERGKQKKQKLILSCLKNII